MQEALLIDTNKILFLPSVQHTGTWFVLSMLERFGYNVVDSKRLLEGGVHINNPSTIQTHFPIESACGVPFDLEINKWMGVNSIQAISKIFKTIIPIRDPLACLLTREARHPELRHFYIVDGFVNMAEKMAGSSNVMFFPIDLNPHPDARRDLIYKMTEHLGIDTTNLKSDINLIANTWVAQNHTPGNRFKKAYEEGNKEEIEFLLGPKMAEVTYLKNKAPIILPFMHSLGYTKQDLNLW